MHVETNDVAGVSRQGGSGVGGGTATGRHHAVPAPQTLHRIGRASLDCIGCSRPVTGVAVVVQGRVFCTWDCAVSIAGPVPGQYFG